jgi:hypothetical protein
LVGGNDEVQLFLKGDIFNSPADPTKNGLKNQLIQPLHFPAHLPLQLINLIPEPGHIPPLTIQVFCAKNTISPPKVGLDSPHLLDSLLNVGLNPLKPLRTILPRGVF